MVSTLFAFGRPPLRSPPHFELMTTETDGEESLGAAPSYNWPQMLLQQGHVAIETSIAK